MMVYGRLNVTRKDFFEEALIVTYRPVPAGGGLPPPAPAASSPTMSRKIYRAQTGSEGAEETRWLAETVAGAGATSGLRPATLS